MKCTNQLKCTIKTDSITKIIKLKAEVDDWDSSRQKQNKLNIITPKVILITILK